MRLNRQTEQTTKGTARFLLGLGTCDMTPNRYSSHFLLGCIDYEDDTNREAGFSPGDFAHR